MIVFFILLNLFHIELIVAFILLNSSFCPLVLIHITILVILKKSIFLQFSYFSYEEICFSHEEIVLRIFILTNLTFHLTFQLNFLIKYQWAQTKLLKGHLFYLGILVNKIFMRFKISFSFKLEINLVWKNILT